MMMLTVYMICFTGQIFITKLEYIFDPPTASFAVAILFNMIMICIFPFHVFYLRARLELGRVILHILASPFGVVKFKHFFFADILTSFT